MSNSQLVKTQTLGLDANIAALLCYAPIAPLNIAAAILWLVTEPKSNTFVRFHAAQSLVLMGVAFAFFVVLGFGMVVIAIIIGAASSTLGAIVGLAINLLFLLAAQGIFIVAVIAMIKAFQGVEWEIPVIGPIARRFA